ncbi:glycyl radical enzyme [Caminicella sporogenes]|nr:glycyl radical enzyme [Caminicella sporogenes]
MNERIQKLRKQSVSAQPYISMERAQLVTEVYQKYEGKVSTPILRALTFKHIMENKKLCINDGELIVGERGEAPCATPTYPELCCHTLEDLEVMHKREKISFKVDEEARKIQEKEIIPYWRGRSMRDKIFKEMTQEWKDCYEAGIFTEFMEQRGPGHTVADDKIYKQGFADLKKKIRDRIAQLDFLNDPDALDKKDELEAMLICADAIITLGKRYSKLAAEMAEKEQDSKRKEELLLISKICDKVPEHKPETFHEALQMYWFVHIGIITELNIWDAFNPGRLDQHLYPFYQKEIEKGTLTPDRAKELLECFWVKFNNQPAPPKVGITLQESATYTDFANINIGGLKADGSDGVNELSFMLLDVIQEMRLLQPSSNVQISMKNPDHFVDRAIEIIKTGFGQPSFFNADEIIEQMVAVGKSFEDARCGGASGCVEVGAFGKEAYILTGYFCFPKVLEITLHNGVDPRTGKKIGLETGDPRNFTSFEELMEAFKKQFKHFIDIKMRGNLVIEKLYAKYIPVPFMSIIIDDCITKAVDYNAGGARYNTNYIQGVGIGTITDCLAAIKMHVYDKKNITMAELMDAMDKNFEGKEAIRNMLLNKSPKYGNDDDYADDLMREVFDIFYNSVNGRKSVRGGIYRIEMLPTTSHVYFGSIMKASANGRKEGEPLSEGISPTQGADTNGPTAVIRSAAKMDHPRAGGTLLNLKFPPNVLEGKEGTKNLRHLIRTYFKMGGHHVQFNVVDSKTLLDAQKNPEKYNDLIVRVAGYSDYFNNLNKGLQDEIIKRTEQSFC